MYILQRTDEEYAAYPILDEMFAITLKTDRMTTGSILIRQDGGLYSGFFVPEGGKIRIRMNKKGKVTFIPPRSNSITEDFSKLSHDSSNAWFVLVQQRDSIAKAEGLTGERLDSLNDAFKNKYNDLIRNSRWQS